MRLLIIGCGYLGTRVAAAFDPALHALAALTRQPERALRFQRAGWAPLLGDVLDPDLALPEVDAVVHALGFDRSSGRSHHEVTVRGLENVLARLPGSPRIVYVSSTGVYAQTDGSEVDETAATEPRDDAAQAILEAEARLPPERSLILRFAGIYGPGRTLNAAALRAGQPIAGDPDAWLNLIHVEDGAQAVRAALERSATRGIVNVSDGHPVRRGAYYAELARLLEAPPPRFGSADAEAWALRRATHRRIVNRRMVEDLGVRLRHPDYRAGLASLRDELREPGASS